MATQGTLYDIRERRKALERSLHIGFDEKPRSGPPHAPPRRYEVHSVGADGVVSDDGTSKQYEGEILGLRQQLAESEGTIDKLERRLQESEVARESLEQLHIDLQLENRRVREDRLTDEGKEAAKLNKMNNDLMACQDDLDVFRRLERKLARFSAIRRHVEGSLLPNTTSNDETRSDLIHSGTDEDDTVQDLSLHSPHLLGYFQYLTSKILSHENRIKTLQAELEENREIMERDAAYAEKLSSEVERYEEMTAAMDLLHTGYQARITELESGIQTKSEADMALQKVRECLVTYPGGLLVLFRAINYDPSFSLPSSLSGGLPNKAKYPYSNQFEKSRKDKEKADMKGSGNTKMMLRKDGSSGPNINRLIGGEDGKILASIQDEDIPVIISRVMLNNASSVAKVPQLEARVAQLKNETMNLEKVRDGQHTRIKELEWRMRLTEDEKENEKRRLQSALSDSVSQVEQQNTFVVSLEDRLDNLNSQVHEGELNIRQLQKKLSSSLSTAGQAPGEDMTFEDLIDITNNALLYDQHPLNWDGGKPPHRDTLGHPELVTSSSSVLPDTPPRTSLLSRQHLNARIKFSPPGTGAFESSGGNVDVDLADMGDATNAKAKRTLERLFAEDPTKIEYKLRQAQAQMSSLKEI